MVIGAFDMKTIQTIVIMSAILSLAGGLSMQSAFAGGSTTGLSASVTIDPQCELKLAAATPSLAFGAVDPVANSAANGGASNTQGPPISDDGFLITLENGGNQNSDVVVSGDNWDDTPGIGGIEVMSAGKTKFSDTAGFIGSKLALPNAEAAQTPAALTTVVAANPIGTEDTFWDLDVDLDILPSFTSGALVQDIFLDFACV